MEPIRTNAQRQMRITTALELITAAVDALEARTRTAYACGYIDGLLDEGQLSVDHARNLNSIATGRRDARLAALGVAPAPNPPQGEDIGRARTGDENAGMTWWNALTEADRRHWMAEAGNTGVVADAWHRYKEGRRGVQ